MPLESTPRPPEGGEKGEKEADKGASAAGTDPDAEVPLSTQVSVSVSASAQVSVSAPATANETSAMASPVTTVAEEKARTSEAGRAEKPFQKPKVRRMFKFYSLSSFCRVRLSLPTLA